MINYIIIKAVISMSDSENDLSDYSYRPDVHGNWLTCFVGNDKAMGFINKNCKRKYIKILEQGLVSDNTKADDILRKYNTNLIRKQYERL